VAATKRLGLEKGLIITHHQNEQIQTNGVEINVVSAWQWALCPLPDQEN
jgi:predicted AAA+ superfamily ATPase